MIYIKKMAFRSLLIVLTITAIVSCKKKDEEGTNAAAQPYVLAFRAQGDAGATADYILKASSLMEGTISAVGKGIEQPGWCYYMETGKSIFSINYGNEGTRAYVANADGKLKESGSFWVDRLDCTGPFDDSHFIGIGAPYDGGSLDCEIMIVDVNKVALSSRKTDRLYSMTPNDKLNKWPSGAIGVNNNIFISFYPMDGITWETPILDTAYLSIYEYPTLKYVKTIKDSRTSPIGTYGNVPCILKTETGDVYTFSFNALTYGYTKTGKPSGILRVKSGQTEFDPGYFLNFEEKFDAKVTFCKYVGNGKALVRYISLAKDAAATVGAWEAYDRTKSMFNMAIVDLESQKITKVADLPVHAGGFGYGVFIENGKAYLPIVSTITNEVRIYEIDPATATAKPGALVEGLDIPYISKF